MSDIKQLAETLVNLKVIEVNDLLKILKEKYNIEPSSTTIPIPESNNSESEKIKEQIYFDVVLKSTGTSKLAVVKLVKEITGLGLKESKELVDKAPKNIKEKISKDEANSIKKQLEDIGAEVELK